MNNIKKQQRNEAVDIFRVICAFLVIIGHTRPFIQLNSNLDFFFTNVLLRIAVPFFFMSSGYLLCRGINKTKDKKIYILRYLKKILTILVATLIGYTIFNLFKFILSSNPTENIRSLFYSIFNNCGKLISIY